MTRESRVTLRPCLRQKEIATLGEITGNFAHDRQTRQARLRIFDLQKGNPDRAFALVDLSLLVADIGASSRALAEGRDHQLRLAVDPNLRVRNARELIAQAVINLIGDAVRQLPEGTAIELAAKRDGNRIRKLVDDNGPGIDEADRARVPDRFVWLEAARSTPGHGLGLSLVRDRRTPRCRTSAQRRPSGAGRRVAL